MPSKLQELQYLGLKVVATLLWVPFTGSLRHGRTWGDLKRLGPGEAAVLLLPLAGYTIATVYIFLVMPDVLLPLAGFVWGAGLVLGGTLILGTTATSKFVDWRLYRH